MMTAETSAVSDPDPTEGTSGLAAQLRLLDTVGSPMLAYRDDTILYANAAMEKLTGRKRETLLGMPFHALAVDEDAEIWQSRAAARLRGAAVPDAYEIRIASTTGEVRQVELQATRVQIGNEQIIIGFLYDLTMRRKAEKRERFLLSLLDQIVDLTPVPIMVIDQNHQVTYWNKACEAITGMPKQEVIGTSRHWQPIYDRERPLLADLIIDGVVEEQFESLYENRVVRSGLIPDAYEAEGYFPSMRGGGRWFYFTAAPIRDLRGRLLGAVETLQDVTPRHQAEDALRAHQQDLERLVAERTAQLESTSEQLVQSEKMASIGQLAAGVAHEINNPIGYVHSNIGSLDNYVEDLFRLLDAYEAAEADIASPERRAQLAALKAEVDIEFLKEDIPSLMHESKEGITRVRKIVQDLKDFSHADVTQEWQFVDIRKGIESTLNIVNNEIKYKADVIRELGPIPDIECLPSQLNQVFMNLLVNAAHAMGDDRGTIRISSRSVDEAHVAVEVSDNGCGIPKDIQKRIFDPFFTTKPIGKGTGLGLSLSYGIVQKHHGRIELESAPGAGTTFRVILPVSQPREEQGE
ncbi:PAS domain S-box protein [Thauera sp. AutoDN2]|uniref:PAS domain S-box protein n=1 Tax=Thauera sp. AutoDN2 TaxID=3416051 RepID=UPI003F4B4474